MPAIWLVRCQALPLAGSPPASLPEARKMRTPQTILHTQATKTRGMGQEAGAAEHTQFTILAFILLHLKRCPQRCFERGVTVGAVLDEHLFRLHVQKRYRPNS